jgi:hypothetical protein
MMIRLNNQQEGPFVLQISTMPKEAPAGLDRGFSSMDAGIEPGTFNEK